MDKEALSVNYLLESSECVFEQDKLLHSPLRAHPGKPPSFTNWDNEDRLVTYVHRPAGIERSDPLLRSASEARKRCGLLTMRNWKEDFPEIEKIMATRSRAGTHPLTKAAESSLPFRLPQWKVLEGREALKDIVFPTSRAKPLKPRNCLRSNKALKVPHTFRQIFEISFSRLELRSSRENNENTGASPRKERVASAFRRSPSRTAGKRFQQ